ncbi:elongation factor 4, partial [Bacillus cereus]|nr:elongation factor 4 [Bacillus cereus]
LLHLEIIRERIEREAGISIIATAPSVVYNVITEDGTHVQVTNPSEYPDGKLREVREPVVNATILTPSEFVGAVMELCQGRRGVMKGMDYLSPE